MPVVVVALVGNVATVRVTTGPERRRGELGRREVHTNPRQRSGHPGRCRNPTKHAGQGHDLKRARVTPSRTDARSPPPDPRASTWPFARLARASRCACIIRARTPGSLSAYYRRPRPAQPPFVARLARHLACHIGLSIDVLGLAPAHAGASARIRSQAAPSRKARQHSVAEAPAPAAGRVCGAAISAELRVRVLRRQRDRAPHSVVTTIAIVRTALPGGGLCWGSILAPDRSEF